MCLWRKRHVRVSVNDETGVWYEECDEDTEGETCVCVLERHTWVCVCIEKRMLYRERKMGVSEWGRDECLCVEGVVEGGTRLWVCL